ncbi:MAG: D-aminoacyl-tRNA deacylase [Egibacteraceae bacterium]
MKVILQRVHRAAVTVDGHVTGRIDAGLVALVGVGRHSRASDARWLATKTESLRVFSDEDGKMNRSVQDIAGGVLAISQFTLYGDVEKSRRPSFADAAAPEVGRRLYELYCEALSVPVAWGVFGAHMDIDMVCDGPVTITLRREAERSRSQGEAF